MMESGFAINKATDSAFAFATIFGVISPNVRIRTVMIPVATATPALPNICVNSSVAMEVARIFTTLFPINIVVIAAVKFLEMLYAVRARLSPFFAICFKRIIFTEEYAVSVDENSALKATSISKTMRRHICDPSKNYHSLPYVRLEKDG